MGKTKTKFNWKARQIPETKIDRTAERKIKLDFGSSGDGQSYDESNALVLPSTKRKTKVKNQSTGPTKLLTKRKRKELEKIVERKSKKANRASLLESLAKVQLPPEVLNLYTTTAQVQTKGLKRRYNEDDWASKIDVDQLKAATTEEKESVIKLNSLKGSGKRRRLLASMIPATKKAKISDPNVVTFEDSTDESLDDDGEFREFELPEVKVEDESEENSEESPPDPEGASLEETSDITPDSTPKETSWETVVVDFDKGSSKKKYSLKSKLRRNPNKVLEFVVSDFPSEQPIEAVNGNTAEVANVSTAEAGPAPAPRKAATFVTVERLKEIQEARLKLPILAEEQSIMETINENQIILVSGETGSGKTTQVPQFLYEAGYTKGGKIIGVTEPRRVAAISMAKRVGEELNLGSDKVSFLIRFEGNVTPETEIKFMTDGVLLKEIQADFLLKKYSVIILDEAHERSVYTDILMGLLSRIVPLRNRRGDPLKLIVMSATLRLENFTDNTRLFKTPPPVVKVESRQFPVTVHFNKRTDPDYLREAYKKVCRIHTTLPEGGILVFLTGQQEVNSLVKKLRKVFPKKNRAIIKRSVADGEVTDDEEEDELNMKRALHKVRRKKEILLPTIDLDSYSVAPNDDTELDMFEGEDSEDEDRWGDAEADAIPLNAQPLWVLPLYSVLPSYKQAKVFAPPPEGTRLCVVATNVAETSLTIPGVKYVVDSGKVKAKLYDKLTGVTGFSVVWTSQAGANQRAGRAGRTGPGHCYRLYSSAVFNDEFEGWSVPEMQRRPVEDLVLQMKALGIQRVVNFPFPSPPDRVQLEVAERNLTLLGALEPSPATGKASDEFGGQLTRLGQSMSRFPVSPRYAKMLCLSHQHGLLEYTVAVVAALSVQEVLLEAEQQGAKVSRAKWAGQGNSLLLGDAMVLLRAVGAAEFANSQGKLEEFCQRNNIRQKAIVEVRKIRLQLTNEINLLNPDLHLGVNPQMIPPNDTQARLLRQIVLAGMVDRVARKTDEELLTTKGKRKPLYNTPELEELVTIHSSSALCKSYPDWIVYQEIYDTNGKTYMRGITAIEPEWLPIFALPLCHMSAPLEDPPPRYDEGLVKCRLTGTFGRSGWELPLVEVEYPRTVDKYRWFAVFFLDGLVCPALANYKSTLLSSPMTMTKTWAKLQNRTEFLIKTLVSKEVDSKRRLYEIWETDPRYLFTAYLQWQPDTLENELALIWPPKDE